MAAVAWVLHSIVSETGVAVGESRLERTAVIATSNASICGCCFAESPLLFGIPGLALLYLGASCPPTPGDPVTMLVAAPLKPALLGRGRP